ncbi:MAG: hypothetical protein U1F34_09140 [Gammaproteobacteria bacterium]
MKSTKRSQTVVLWLSTASLAFILCMYDMAGALINGEFIPSDHDSFYHARRIIDAIPDLSKFYQFDPRIHAPEGSWITWPWGYDFTVAAVTKLLMSITGVTHPMSIIAFIAPAWVFVNAAFLLGIARKLSLSFGLQIIVMICFACSMLTRSLHRVGMVDHHYIEHTFVLATLYCGLCWFSDLSNWKRAATMGVVLGLAPAFHNGDFILQIPVLGALLLVWLLGKPIDQRGCGIFAATLVLSTALALIPSQPFYLGMFSYYLHSWFHLYVAACTAVASVFLSFADRRLSTGVMFFVGACLAVSPLISEIVLGREFLFGELIQLDQMGEVSSVLGFVQRGETGYMLQLYSCLIGLLPFGIAWSVWRLKFSMSAQNIFLAVFVVCGTSLLFIQFRLEYFGAFALWLLPALFVNDMFGKCSKLTRKATLGLGMAMLGAMVPSLATLRTPVAPGADLAYARLRDMFLAIHDACARDPGVILADHNFGHYITYHSDCSVIADNFILTKQHEEKLRLSLELFHSNVSDVLKRARYIKYIMVARADRVGIDKCFPACAANTGLRHQLLESNGPFPDEVRFLGEVQGTHDGVTEPLARLFKVVRQ